MAAHRSRATAPLVSVVMPVYNGRTYLAEAVRSILDQSVDDLELLVVDDGSTDGSAELAEAVGDSRTRVVRAEHGGEGAARNRGLDEARGRWVAWHDSDDVALPNRLQALLQAVEGGADFAHHDMLLVDTADRPTCYLKSSAVPAHHVLPHLLREGTPFNNPTMLVRRSVLDGVRFDEGLVIGVDTDLVRRFAPRTQGVHVPEPLTLYRRHEGSIGIASQVHDHWPHVERLVEDEPLEALVPAAFRSPAGAQEATARALVGLALFRRGFEVGATQQFDLATRSPLAADAARVVSAAIDLACRDHRAALDRLVPGSGAVADSLRGDALAGLGDAAAAAAAYRSALAVDPSCYDALVGLRAVGEALGTRVVDDPRRRLLGIG